MTSKRTTEHRGGRTTAPVDTIVIDAAVGPVVAVRHDEVIAARGLPFAVDPTGSQRLAAPRRAPRWDAPRDATRIGPAVPQPPSRLRRITGETPTPTAEAGSLHLNVWTPGLTGSRAVLLWFHGGAWTTGSASWDCYDGAALTAAEGIVVVTANYRLGALGYLHSARLGLADASGPAASALGLADQVMALEWVVENIADFGGDPNRITVGGQSAGAEAAIHLGALPETRDLITGVIAQSAPAGWAQPAEHQISETTSVFFEALGLDGDHPAPHLVARAAEIPDILGAHATAMRHPRSTGSLLPPFRPTVAGSLRWQSLPEAVAAFPATTRLLIGSNADETRAFFDGDERIAGTPRGKGAALAEEFVTGGADAYRRLESADRSAPVPRLITEAVTHAGIAAPSLAAARVARAAWTYRVDLAGPVGACHCIDLPLLFGRERFAGALVIDGIDVDRLTAATGRFRGAIGAFVREDQPGWGAFGDTGETLVID
ncbi:carboxylesterase family protein [Microbacterium sp. SSM24]|uniref:carboxylesterase family protein n=1 Tax=Microbacterium sp. SSM24 TaxID=2991714 RepID=UPI002225E178|nr:carboxylesterase family protein [Microbacterium sp. SSM24]MCW3492616.1 carboxylesterase family protein [Microbacterium sp. SSM24]